MADASPTERILIGYQRFIQELPVEQPEDILFNDVMDELFISHSPDEPDLTPHALVLFANPDEARERLVEWINTYCRVRDSIAMDRDPDRQKSELLAQTRDGAREFVSTSVADPIGVQRDD